ncbi:hypothetical protein ACJW31_11G175200 [Castanea mollissima]
MNHTIMEYEAIWKLKPSDLQLILCIPRKYTKASIFCCIKCEYQLVPFHHFLKSNVNNYYNFQYDAQQCHQKISCIDHFSNFHLAPNPPPKERTSEDYKISSWDQLCMLRSCSRIMECLKETIKVQIPSTTPET